MFGHLWNLDGYNLDGYNLDGYNLDAVSYLKWI